MNFSPNGQLLASGSQDGTIKLWNSATGQLHATLLTLPEVAEQTTGNAKALSIGAKALSIGAKAIEAAPGEWFVTTPEGWFDCSANAAQFIRWRVNNQVVPAERYYRVLRHPQMVQKALRGEAVPEPDLTNLDVPPQAQFTRVQYDDKAASSVTVTLDTQGRRNVKEINLLVNGRPLPPESEAPLQVENVAVSEDITARGLDVGARPLHIGARALDIGARPLDIGAKDLQRVKASGYTTAKRYTFKVPLPVGAPEIKLRAQVYDDKELGSNPTEVLLSRPNAKRVPGNLYILCAGIGKYKNGSDGGVETATSFSNLKFSGADARSVVERLQAEGAPLYEKVEVFNGGPLLDGQATLTNLRAGLKWLQRKARPGQVDTVIIYLSGHGLSDPQGKYYFPTYDFDKANWQATSLSGKELQQELGGKLRARSVFLFVDTCHSGALAGARSDDLNFDVNSSGVYMLASSGASQYSYERDEWGHGAFTLALLKSLQNKELAPDGTIKFNVLTYAVPDEIAKLMKQIGQSESAMAPVVPLEGRRLDEAVAQVK